MAEMRENIQTLETKQKQHQRYTAFVSLIERRVEAIAPNLKIPAVPVKTEWKETANPQTIKMKISIEAMQKRDKIPIEYRPTIKLEPLTKGYKTLLASSAAHIAISNPAKTIAAIILSADFKRPKEPFTAASVAPSKDNATRSIWYKEVEVRIKSLDVIRATRTPIVIQEPMESSKVWMIEANERGHAILDRMQADIRERKAEKPKTNPAGFSGSFNNPSKSATDEEVIQKVKIEAKACRAKIPTGMRVERSDKAALETTRLNSGYSDHVKTSGNAEKMRRAFNTTSKRIQEPQHPPPPEARIQAL